MSHQRIPNNYRPWVDSIMVGAGQTVLTEEDLLALNELAEGDGGSTSLGDLGLATTTTAGRLARYTGAAGEQGQTTGLFEDASGNVGVGTASPSSPLDVHQNGSRVFSVSNNSSWHVSNNPLYFSNQSQSHRSFFSNNELRFGSSASLGWDASTAAGAGGRDAAVSRLSAAKIAVGNGVGGDYTGTLIAGNVGVGMSSPTARLDNAGDTYRQRTARTPASATAAGNTGDICWDADYIYVCTATNVWRRTPLATW